MKRKFEDKKRDTLKRKRKPLMFLSLEGNNKTEKLYLKALNKDNNKYALIFTPGRESDPINMYKSLKRLLKSLLMKMMVIKHIVFVIEILKFINWIN